MFKTTEIILIIRSIGERTEQLCKKLILDQGIPEKQVLLVKEVPLSAAMRKAYELGIESGAKWTLCIDADVLLRPGSIAYMLQEAEIQPKQVCEIQGLVLDKFFGGPRPAGNHLFRTKYLKKVIKRIPEEGVNIRPERYTLGQMEKDGFLNVKIPYVIGLHDDEQYNCDIYRKVFVQGVKHIHLAKLFSEIWKANIEHDHDFKVALYAFSDRFKNLEPVYINCEYDLFNKMFKATGFLEKPELDLTQFDLEAIERKIQQWKEPDAYRERYPAKFGLVEPDKKEQTTSGNGTDTMLSTVVYNIGRILMKIGEKTCKIAKNRD